MCRRVLLFSFLCVHFFVWLCLGNNFYKTSLARGCDSDWLWVWHQICLHLPWTDKTFGLSGLICKSLGSEWINGKAVITVLSVNWFSAISTWLFVFDGQRCSVILGQLSMTDLCSVIVQHCLGPFITNCAFWWGRTGLKSRLHKKKIKNWLKCGL